MCDYFKLAGRKKMTWTTWKLLGHLLDMIWK